MWRPRRVWSCPHTEATAPGDIAVVGFDDILLARYVQPSLSTVGASRFTWGSLPATGLIEFIENGEPPEIARVPVRFIARESSTMQTGRTG